MSDDCIVFPEGYDRSKLNALYRQIPLKDNTIRTLRRYFTAMAHLYGIIPLDKAWEIIHSQCPRMVKEAEFYAFAEIARHECRNFFIMGEDELYCDIDVTDPSRREIIDPVLFILEEDLYFLTKEHQQGKPYYVPDKQELLRYSDWLYYEKTPQRQQLADYCAQTMQMSPQVVQMVISELEDRTTFFNPNPHDWLSLLDMPEVELENQEQANAFLQLCQDAYNNGRMQCNRGHTPREMFDMYPPEQRVPKELTFGPNIRKAIADGSINADEMRAQILSLDLPNEQLRLSMLRQIAEIENAARPQKVSRNAPCPCGSGRKYKNCCGRILS